MKTWIALALAALLALPAGAAEMGEDGLHKQPYFALTFKDVAEDLDAAAAEGKRLAYIFEQRGCSYCKAMHEQVFSDPEVAEWLKANFMIVQMNLFGDEEVTDLDGTALPEKEMAKRWNVVFTPTIVFMPEEAGDAVNAGQAAVAVMPGAFAKGTAFHMFQWVDEKGYEGEEHFQKYHARKLEEG